MVPDQRRSARKQRRCHEQSALNQERQENMSDRYITRDVNIATYLLHAGGRSRRAVVLIADNGHPVFSFADSPELQADVIAFTQGARVAAMEYGQAANVIAKLVRQA